MGSNIALNSNSRFECQRCGRKQIITDFDSGEAFCSNCGFVINERLENFRHESNQATSQKDTARTGTSITLSRNDFGLSTVIGSQNKDSRGNTISLDMLSTMRRIRIQDSRSHLARYSDASLKMAFDFLERVQDKLGVPDSVKETAAYIYRKAAERRITTGRQIYSVVAASMYIACRNTQTLRNLSDISEATNIKRKKISQSYRAIVKQLDLKMLVVNQTDYVFKITGILKASAATRNLALEILKKAEKLDMLAGRDPVGMAAASAYYSSLIRNEGFTQKQIADASRITAVTVRNRFHEIRKNVPLQNGRAKDPDIVDYTYNKSKPNSGRSLLGKFL